MQTSSQTHHRDRIIVVMGPTGSGKSTFIKTAAHQDDQTVGHGLLSFTSEIRSVTCTRPIDSHPTVFIDTPGFDDTYRSDTEVLSKIADWLVTTYKQKIALAGILYLHRISDNRMTGTTLRNLRLFASVCGLHAMPGVSLVTTMWDNVGEEAGARREAELQATFWKDMLDSGCKTERFNHTFDSAWAIIERLFQRDLTSLQLPQDIVDTHLRLNETQAGITLYKELQKLIKDQKLATQRLQKQAKRQDDELLVKELNEQRLEIEERIRHTAAQLRQMKIPIGRHLRLIIKSRTLRPGVAQKTSPTADYGLEFSTSPPSDGSSKLHPLFSDDNEEYPSPRSSSCRMAVTSVLRYAAPVAGIAPIPFLGGVVSLALTVAESIEAMERTEDALKTLAKNARRLSDTISEQLRIGEIPEDLKQVVEDLSDDLEDVLNVLSKMASTGWLHRYILQRADEQVFSACSNKIRDACELFRLRSEIILHRAVARLEARLDELPFS